MKTLITLALSLLLASGGAFAEEGAEKGPGGAKGKGKGDRSGERMARMQEHLGLSDEQMSQMQEIRANGGSREEMRAVLTEEQQEKMRAHRKARMEAGKGRQGKGKGKGGGRNAPADTESETAEPETAEPEAERN